MSRATNQANIALAQKFFSKFGMHAEIDIDQFDMFIIDRKMVKDPGSREENPLAYKGFVSDRSVAKKRLNAGAVFLNDDAFRINVQVKGATYITEPYNEQVRDDAEHFGEAVHQFASRKADRLQQTQALIEEVINTSMADDIDISDWQHTKSMLELGEAHVQIFVERVSEMQLKLDGHMKVLNAKAAKQIAMRQAKLGHKK